MTRTTYWLTPPARLTFIVSVILVETLLIGYLVLLVGNLFRGL